jgi:hypothetical protein
MSVYEDIKTGLKQAIAYERGEVAMDNNINLIDDEIPVYRKKSKKKGRPRANHKHAYETVLLTRYYHSNLGEPRTSEFKYPTKVCTICGRIDYIDEDLSYYVNKKVVGIPFLAYEKDLSEKALSLPKWRADSFDKFAVKVED